MSSAPIVVHRPSVSGGRRVSVHRHGRGEILGTAYSDHDLVVFLEGAGIEDAEAVLDDRRWVEWRGGPAHDLRHFCASHLYGQGMDLEAIGALLGHTWMSTTVRYVHVPAERIAAPGSRWGRNRPRSRLRRWRTWMCGAGTM